jgi:transcriptional regulator with XRE-family HTH domain
MATTNSRKPPGSAPPNNIKSTLKHLGISQERAARLLGVSFSTLNAWATRKITLTDEMLRAIGTLEVLHREEAPQWCKEGKKLVEDVAAIRKHSRTCEQCVTVVEYLYRERK